MLYLNALYDFETISKIIQEMVEKILFEDKNVEITKYMVIYRYYNPNVKKITI